VNQRNCHQFDRRFHEVLDERLPLEQDALLNKHARQCPSCARKLQLQQRISAIVRDTRSKVPHDNRSAQVRRRFNSTKNAFALVAMVIVGVGLALSTLWLSPSRPQIARTDSNPQISPRSHPAQAHQDQDRESLPLVQWQRWISVRRPSHARWLAPVVEPIQPLANSMSSTWSVLRRTIVPAKRPKKSDPDSMGYHDFGETFARTAYNS
jgi:hypothetical protein